MRSIESRPETSAGIVSDANGDTVGEWSLD
jgi:hypothetical protein